MKHWLRFPPPLHFLVLLFVLACGTVSLIIKTLVLDRGKIEQFVGAQSATAQGQAQALVDFLNSPEQDEQDRLEKAATQLYSIKGQLRWAAICDAQGKVLHC